MLRRVGTAGVVALLVALVTVVAWAATSPGRGAQFIASQQSSSGAWSDAQTTGETLAAMLAGRVSGTQETKALAYLKSHGQSGATEGAYTGRIIAGLVAAGQNPRSFGGVNYVDILHTQYDASAPSYDTKNIFADLIAANGANAAKDPIPQEAIDNIESSQCDDGGFSALGCDQGSDVDTTAWAINVLVASGHKADDAVGKARSYLLSVQRQDGAFALSTASSCNCNFTSSDSTGLAISAINALGEDPTKAPWVKKNGNPVTTLGKLQTSNGSFRANGKTSTGNLYSTVNAVPGLAHHSYPIFITAKPKPRPTPRKSSAPAKSSEPTDDGSDGSSGGGSGGGGGGSGGVTGTTSGAHNATDTARVATSTNKQATSSSSSKGGTSSSSKNNKGQRGNVAAGPSNLGFGGITTKKGGIPIVAWASIAVGCAGIGAGVWFLRARFR